MCKIYRPVIIILITLEKANEKWMNEKMKKWIHLKFRKCLKVETVSTFSQLKVETVCTFCKLKVETVSTFNDLKVETLNLYSAQSWCVFDIIELAFLKIEDMILTWIGIFQSVTFFIDLIIFITIRELTFHYVQRIVLIIMHR